MSGYQRKVTGDSTNHGLMVPYHPLINKADRVVSPCARSQLATNSIQEPMGRNRTQLYRVIPLLAGC